MERRYLFIEPDGDITRGMFRDLENAEDIDVFLKPCEISSRILRRLKQIHFSRLINSVVPLPFKGIWDKYYTIAGYPFQPDCEYFLIIGNYAATFIDYHYLEKLRR